MKGSVLAKPTAAHPRKLRRERAARPYLWMLSGSLAFAVMATLAHALGVRYHCDWQVIAIARTGLALVLAAGLARAAGARLVLRRPRILWVRSIAGSISLIATFYAFTRLPVSDVLTLTSLFPIWVALLSWPLLKERPTGSVWLSVASSTVGVALVQQPHFAQGNFATLIALGASFFTAIALMGLHQLQHVDVRAIVVHFSGVSLLFCVAAFFLFEHGYALASALEGSPLVMLLGVGVSATVGQLFLTKAFAAGPPAKVSVVGLTQIVFVMVLEVFLTDRSFAPATLLGIVLVMAPTAWLMVKSGAPEF